MTVGAEVGASVVGEVGEAVVGALEGAPVVGAAEGDEEGAIEGALVVGAAVGAAVMSSYVDSHSHTHELTAVHLPPPAHAPNKWSDGLVLMQIKMILCQKCMQFSIIINCGVRDSL